MSDEATHQYLNYPKYMSRLPHWPIPHSLNDIKLGLDRIQELLTRIGNPEREMPPAIHIAGTNGKGSVFATLRAIFRSTGYDVHGYISPHLIECNERIMIRNEQITDRDLYRFGEICRVAAEQDHDFLSITFFEGMTAIAFAAFAENIADVSLIEVGMGGRLDATNVIKSPVRKISVITPISLDHVEYLGSNVYDIAKEKCGILEKDVPAVISWQLNDAMQSIREECFKRGAIPVACGYEWEFRRLEDDNIEVVVHESQIFPERATYILPKPKLIGVHQYINAATSAVAALVAMREKCWNKIDVSDIVHGIANAQWPARMERITSGVLASMVPSRWELWMDGAHNVAGAQMLSASIDELDAKNSMPLYIINGRSKQKNEDNIAEFLSFFCGKAQLVCAIQVQNESRAQDAKTIADIASALGMHGVECEDVYDAILTCTMHAKDNSIDRARVVICGSLYLAGDILFANSV